MQISSINKLGMNQRLIEQDQYFRCLMTFQIPNEMVKEHLSGYLKSQFSKFMLEFAREMLNAAAFKMTSFSLGILSEYLMELMILHQ